MELDLLTLGLLALAALLAGFIDAIAGGGGLITVPALLATGMPPTMALATNKLQSCFGSFSASFYYLRRGLIDWRIMKWAVACTFVGSMLGTLLVQRIDASVLEKVLPFLLAAFALYFLFSPRVGDEDRSRRLGVIPFALVVGTGVGFYDGFFGPGTGSFFALGFIALAGYSMGKATAHTKLLNFTSNFASLLFFMLGGQVVWIAGLAMAGGQFLGARLGSRMVVTRGTRMIRPMLVTVSLVMSARLLWQQYPQLFDWMG
ncbi:TSUP family transporter [Oceanimonas pelagia]|uniref:Probable membrane transporter protein n=1 Tax=Oceanimonas pelagia TaxID=3028314 RepID=A0AA50KQD9_9GAMM|nr:TSUP family transporter [Oceanimonas pelagia]WMC11789.1 TSUP family transporter [Oceanimonas pelagia]